MAPSDGLIFAGYRSFDAGINDPFRIKWDVVRPSLELPAGAAVPALTMAAIGALNADINRRIVYTPEPDSGDAWQTPAQTFRESFTEVVMLSVLREQLKVINPWLQDDQVDEVVKQLTASFPSTSLIHNNRHAFQLLR